MRRIYWVCFFLLLSALAGVALASQGPVQVLAEADMPDVGDACRATFYPNLKSREYGYELACVGGSFVSATPGEHNVLAYGGACGGSAQQIPVIAAIDAASADGGGVVTVPADCILGTAASIILKADVTIRCEDNNTSQFRKDWSTTGTLGSHIYTDGITVTPTATKQNNAAIVNCNFTYASTCGGGSDPCEGAIFSGYGDGIQFLDNKGDWYEDKAVASAGDYWLIDGNELRQVITTGAVGDDGIRLTCGGLGTVVSNNIVASGDDCYDANFGDTGTGDLINCQNAGTLWVDNYCDSELASLWSCVAQQDSDGTGTCSNQIVSGMTGEAGGYCLRVLDQLTTACVGVDDPYDCCTGVDASDGCNEAYNDQLSDIIFSDIKGDCDTNGYGSTDAVRFTGANRITLTSFSFEGVDSDSINLTSDNQDIRIGDGYLDASASTGDDGANLQNGISVLGANNARISIYDNTILMPSAPSNAQSGIKVGGGAGTTCTDCSVVGNTIQVGNASYGIYLDGPDGLLVSGNMVSEITGATTTTCAWVTVESDGSVVLGNRLDGCDTATGGTTKTSTLFGNVGLASDALNVDGADASLVVASRGGADVAVIDLENEVSGSNASVGWLRGVNLNNSIAEIRFQRISADDAGRIEFWTRDTLGALTNRGRFDRTGEFEVLDDLEVSGLTRLIGSVGTDPAATCTAGEIWIDTDGSTTAVNCTGGAAGIPRICICASTDTWTSIE